MVMHYLGMKYKREHALRRSREKSGYVRFLDKLTFVFGIIGPFTVVPQIYGIFSTRSAEGVSLATWLLIFIVTFPWILYGVANRDKTIIISFVLWEIMNLSVVIGVLLYGGV